MTDVHISPNWLSRGLCNTIPTSISNHVQRRSSDDQQRPTLAKNTKPCRIAPQIRCKDTKRTIQLLQECNSCPLYPRHDGKDWSDKIRQLPSCSSEENRGPCDLTGSFCLQLATNCQAIAGSHPGIKYKGRHCASTCWKIVVRMLRFSNTIG